MRMVEGERATSAVGWMDGVRIPGVGRAGITVYLILSSARRFENLRALPKSSLDAFSRTANESKENRFRAPLPASPSFLAANQLPTEPNPS